MLASAIALSLWASTGPILPVLASLRGERVQQHRHARAESSHIPKEDSLAILHIGKTGGSRVRDLLQDYVTDSVHILDHKASHRWARVCQSHPKLKLALFVRSPVHRYVAGWLSRYTKGQPDYYFHWKEKEQRAFEQYRSPDELACSLNSTGRNRMGAEDAIGAIQHTHWDLQFYLGPLENVRRCKENFVFVGRTEHLKEDHARLVDFLREGGWLAREPPSQPEAEYRPLSQRLQNRSLDALRMLSKCSVDALHSWYSEDYDIIEFFAKQGLLENSYLQEVGDADTAPPAGQMLSY